jgi:hypothetical protein
MATRTAPAVTGAVTSVITTLRLIDASGDQIAVSITTVSAPSAANVEAWAAAYQVATKASLWSVQQTNVWEGDADPDNADVGQRNSVKDGVNLLYKNLTNLNTQPIRLVAPVDDTMQGNQDIPLLTADPEFTTLLSTTAAILSGYSLLSAQYTERSERKNNPRIKV